MKLHQHIRREQSRHTDDWLITYADTITLLLCLFVVILSMKTAGDRLPRSLVTPPEAPVIRTAVSDDIFGGHSPFPPMPRVTDVRADKTEIAGDGSDAATEEPRRTTVAADPAPPAGSRDMVEAHPETPRAASMAAVETPPVSASLPVAEPGTIASSPRPSAAADGGQLGDRITMLQISSAAFFGSGYATLSGAGKSILRDVAVTLKSEKYAAYNISIEGHTDDTPISTAQFQSNWELSTARAAAVVRFLLELGVPARKLSAAGYADTFPIAPNRTEDGTVIPENQARNRRVVIKLEKIDKAER